MKIVKAEVSVVEIPFPFDASGVGIMPTPWRSLEFALVRLEDELGNVGWGEAFGYFVVDASKAIIERLILPRLIGATVTDIPAWNRRLQLDLHLFGRYGATVFAISGVDIALWDLAAKRQGVPLHQLLSDGDRPARTTGLRSYASLMRYGDTALAVAACEQALGRGYTAIKLHETDMATISACREAIGPDVPLSVDVNCQWGSRFFTEHRKELAGLGVAWVEEPVFPPEDFSALAALRSPGIPLAAGENWCTAEQFAQSGGAVDIWQPSVTKVGGISEYLRILAMAAAQGHPVVPHCPYFGPGYFATLHLAAAHPAMDDIEILYTDPEAWLCDVEGLRDGGALSVPAGPGLGFEPDPDVMEKYRRA
ncbi:mandelate racemase/muconate lactonizing enzyme family protein [Streptomyces sp. NPDC002491]